MKRTEFWRWNVAHPFKHGKTIATRHRMTEQDALAGDPSATRVPGSLEVRDLPETQDELNAGNLTMVHSAWARARRGGA
jgi:hypothetical protein